MNQLSLGDDVFIISDEIWSTAKRELINKFAKSNKLEICINIIKDFEDINPKKKYKSDLEVFIRESKLEDFLNNSRETIFVSTIHKAKGKEFDNVFIMLENFNPSTDEAKRHLYIAMTRVKKNLTVHLNSNFLNDISAENIEHVEDKNIYLPPNELAIHLTYKDVWLDYFIRKQYLVSQFICGDVLSANCDECLNSKGQSVLKFSMQFANQIKSMKQRNYELKSAKVNFIVYWLKDGADQEVKIILPELYFEKIILN